MAEETNPPIEIPREALSPEALEGLIESFILREGTDYGREEAEHTHKIHQILRQLEKGHIHIIFDSQSESVTLMTDRDWQKARKSAPDQDLDNP